MSKKKLIEAALFDQRKQEEEEEELDAVEDGDSSDEDENIKQDMFQPKKKTRLTTDEAIKNMRSKLEVEHQTNPSTFRNKQRVLILCSRGTPALYRHLMKDLIKMIPHHKKESKLDDKNDTKEINEIAELRSCNNCLFFESRKSRHCYLWASHTPNGPSAKFQILNAHSMDELEYTGNCLMYSRPILSFDKNFDTEPQYQLIKELFTQIFSTPKGHPDSKPFTDHVLSFHIEDKKIWFRCYQIVDKVEKKKRTRDLIEIGPRFVLEPIKIFSGSFGGPVIYTNGSYVTPTTVTASKKKEKNIRYMGKVLSRAKRAERLADAMNGIPENPLDEVFRD